MGYERYDGHIEAAAHLVENLFGKSGHLPTLRSLSGWEGFDGDSSSEDTDDDTDIDDTSSMGSSPSSDCSTEPHTLDAQADVFGFDVIPSHPDPNNPGVTVEQTLHPPWPNVTLVWPTAHLLLVRCFDWTVVTPVNSSHSRIIILFFPKPITLDSSISSFIYAQFSCYPSHGGTVLSWSDPSFIRNHGILVQDHGNLAWNDIHVDHYLPLLQRYFVSQDTAVSSRPWNCAIFTSNAFSGMKATIDLSLLWENTKHTEYWMKDIWILPVYCEESTGWILCVAYLKDRLVHIIDRSGLGAQGWISRYMQVCESSDCLNSETRLKSRKSRISLTFLRAYTTTEIEYPVRPLPLAIRMCSWANQVLRGRYPTQLYVKLVS